MPSASLRSSARWRLTGTFTRIRRSGASRADSQRRRPPAVAPSTTSLTVRCVPNASRSRPIAARSVDANAATRGGPDAPCERRAGNRRRELALDGRRQPRDVGEDVSVRRLGHDRPRRTRRRGIDVPQERRGDPPDRHAVRHRVVDLQHHGVATDEVDGPQRPIAVEVLLHELCDRVLQRVALRVLTDVLVEVEPRIRLPTPGRRPPAPAGPRERGMRPSRPATCVRSSASADRMPRRAGSAVTFSVCPATRAVSSPRMPDVLRRQPHTAEPTRRDRLVQRGAGRPRPAGSAGRSGSPGRSCIELAQRVGVVGRLDALGDGLQPERLGERTTASTIARSSGSAARP